MFRLLRQLALMAVVAAGLSRPAQARAQAASAPTGASSEKGADTCQECHGDVDGSDRPLRCSRRPTRSRDSAGLSGDYTVGETAAIGVFMDYNADDYREALIGLKGASSVSLGLVTTGAIHRHTCVSVFGQAERQPSRQARRTRFSLPDWSAESRDRTETVGVNLGLAAIPDKLDLGVLTPSADPGFPTASNTLTCARLFGNDRLSGAWRIDASLLFERLRSTDWHLDGIQPATLPKLLAFGAQSPNHDVGVLQVSARDSF